MSRTSSIVQAVAHVFAGLNIAGAGFAIAEKEAWHAGVHVALGLLGLIVGWALRLRETRVRSLRESSLELQVVDLEAELADARAQLDQLRGLVARPGEAWPTRV